MNNVRCVCLRSYVAHKPNGPQAEEHPTVQVPAQLRIAHKPNSLEWTHHHKNRPQRRIRRLRRSSRLKTATLSILGRSSQVEDYLILYLVPID